MWMTPFYLFFGVLFIYIFQTQININKLKGFVSVFLILFIFSPFAYAYVSVSQTDKRTDYPGRKIAQLVHQEWKDFIESNKSILYKKIDVVGREEWFAGNLSYYLGGNRRPKVYMDNFIHNLAKKGEKRNSILILPSDQLLKFCDNPEYILIFKNYLIHKAQIIDHYVCFFILKPEK